MMKTSFLPRPSKIIKPRADLPDARDTREPKPIVTFQGWDVEANYAPFPQAPDPDESLLSRDLEPFYNTK